MTSLDRMKQYRDYAINNFGMTGEMLNDFNDAINALEKEQSQLKNIEESDLF